MRGVLIMLPNKMPPHLTGNLRRKLYDWCPTSADLHITPPSG